VPICVIRVKAFIRVHPCESVVGNSLRLSHFGHRKKFFVTES
jgi:hypothetical protein